MKYTTVSAWLPKFNIGNSLRAFVSGLSLLVWISAAQASPISFYAISSISSNTAATDDSAASRLIEGAGVGFDANAPYSKLNSSQPWYTTQPCYPCDYFTSGRPVPVLTLDLGQNQLLSEISVWGHGNPNSVSRFSLRFATAAEGTGAFGTSIIYNPVFLPAQQSLTMQEFGFSQSVVARYVEFRALDNFYASTNPGAGGDRVALHEIAFEAAIPEPGSLALVGVGLFAAAAFRRRARPS